MRVGRSASALGRVGLCCLLFVVSAWQSALPRTRGFCGTTAGGVVPKGRSLAPTQRPGWRLDMIEFGPKGIGQLVIHEGYFIGEKAMYEIMSKAGRRYRMRATGEEMEKGIDVPPITQIGPIKLRLYESFGGSGRMPGLTRPEGYRGIAGVAGWDTDLPIKGGGFDAAPKALL
eukprot:CAMPEP_0117515826 /NCGR_PEP_ID=MMETSP0784-20121206/30780_1 /TAXON_ID=39447 /ORGANISM="" /LENGTH=172 /DNA_ID=CAMNT_0005311655 /DNA_START=1 /DNA_END=519 /DNA_ORIENTATION=+